MTGQGFCQNPVFGDDDEAAVVTRASDPEGLGAVGAGHRGVGDRRKRQQDDEDGDDRAIEEPPRGLQHLGLKR